MKKNPYIFLLILCGVIILVADFYVGMLAQTQKDSPQIKTLSSIQNLLQSKVFVKGASFLAYGTVTKIDGKKITLTSITAEKESLEIPLSNDVVVSFASSSGATGTGKGANLPIIKVGNRAGVDIKLDPSGQFEGTSVKILP